MVWKVMVTNTVGLVYFLKLCGLILASFDNLVKLIVPSTSIYLYVPHCVFAAVSFYAC